MRNRTTGGQAVQPDEPALRSRPHRPQRFGRSRALALFLGALALELACASPSPSPSPGPEAGARYVNESLGIAVHLPRNWSAFTDRDSAPRHLEQTFPPNKGPDESPLLIASSPDQQRYVRVLVDHLAVPFTTLEYHEAAYLTSRDDTETLEARATPDGRVVRWVYEARLPAFSLTFTETLSVRGQTAFRVAFWTVSEMQKRNRGAFDRLASQIAFREGETWTRPWAHVADTLAEADLDYVEIAAPEAPPVPQPLACDGPRKAIFWRATSGDTRLHILGSLHLGRPDFYPLPQPVEDAFARSKALYAELDLSDPSVQLKLSALMQSEGQLPADETIRDVLSTETYERLEAAYGDLGLPLTAFASLRPWVQSMVLVGLRLRSLGYLEEQGVDRYFLDRVGDRDVVGFETPEQQIRLLSSLDGEGFLAVTLDDLDRVEEFAPEMVRSWRCGEDEKLAALLMGSFDAETPESGAIRDKLIDDRNREMANRLDRLRGQSGDYFVVVGSGHVLGDSSIVELMRSRGWQIERP